MDMQYIMKLTFCMLISFYETWICIHTDIIPDSENHWLLFGDIPSLRRQTILFQ